MDKVDTDLDETPEETEDKLGLDDESPFRSTNTY